MSPKRLNVALPRPWRLHQTGHQLDGHEPSLAEHHKDGIHMVRSTTLAPSVTVRSTCSDIARYHFGILRQIHSIRRSVPQSTLSTLISSFVVTKLDYCNIALASLPSCDLDRLQSVINAATCLTVGTHRHNHITPLLADLHWLRIPQRIQYKLYVLVYQCVQGSAPSYLPNAICSVASAEPRRHLRSKSSADLIVPAMRRTTMGDRAFAIAGSRAWNSLPDAIRRSTFLAVFKRSLKTHFYIQCF